MRRTSSRTLAATSLLALLTALAVPNRAEAEERANHATTVRMVRDAEHDVVGLVAVDHDIARRHGLSIAELARKIAFAGPGQT